jgi:hypothetical protein
MELNGGRSESYGKITIIGTGPGDTEHLSKKALESVKASET